jgi:hypothetical protein
MELTHRIANSFVRKSQTLSPILQKWSPSSGFWLPCSRKSNRRAGVAHGVYPGAIRSRRQTRRL